MAVLTAAALVLPNQASGQSVADGFSGFATATVLHADALQSGDTRVVNVDVGFSSAAVSSTAVLGGELQNEMQRVIHPESQSNAYARGSGVELGLVRAPNADGQLILAGKAEASEPTEGEPVVEEIAVPGNPAVYASVARGLAENNCGPGCSPIEDGDLARGVGFVSRLQLLNAGEANEDGSMQGAVIGLDAPDPDRAVSQAVSRTNVEDVEIDGASVTAMVSEARTTIAPITLLRGSGSETTVELLGEWVLRATAGGTAGTATIHYGPADTSPQTPVVRIIRGGDVTNILTLQQVLGDDGLSIAIPGVAEITVGEPPRAIGGEYESEPTTLADGTLASAAVDVARIKLFESVDEDDGTVTQRAAQVRVGHMEVLAQVGAAQEPTATPTDTPEPTAPPENPTPPQVTKTANPSEVFVGQNFTTTISVRNEFDCEITTLRLTDVIEAEEGRSARFRIVTTSPQADSVPAGERLQNGTIIWNDVGPVAPGETKSVDAVLQAQAEGSFFPAKITDRVTADATFRCPEGRALVTAEVSVTSDALEVGVSQVLPAQLPRTGGDIAQMAFTALTMVEAGGALVLVADRRRRRAARRARS